MINVMLICEYGISTSMMEEAIKKEAKSRGVDLKIEAYSITDVKKYIYSMDYVLLGPQVGFRISELKKKYPEQAHLMHIIDPGDFALLNSKKVLNQILKFVDNK